MGLTALALFGVLSVSVAEATQFVPTPNPNAERAWQAYRLGWDYLSSEQWEDAEKEFLRAINIDNKFKLAFYGLGRADMALKKFNEAAKAYEMCRGLYQAQASENFQNRQEADRIRQNDLQQLQIAISTLSARGGTGARQSSTQLQIQHLRAHMDRIQMRRDADASFSLTSEAPAFVSLALGSAYFRLARLEDAEREYKTTLLADPKAGEAHNNLAVVYLLTGRLVEAEKAVQSAEKSGFKVNPMLKEDIAKAKQRGR